MQTFTFGTTPTEVILLRLDAAFTMTLVGEDCETVIAAVNEGVDSHLEAITGSSFDWDGRGRLICNVAPNDMLVLLRRLYESDADSAWSLRTSILCALDIEEV